MSVEQAAKQIETTDKALRDGREVDKDGLVINLTTLYRRYGWSKGSATPLPKDALTKLKISDRTGDPRWMVYFNRSGKQLGVYRSNVGYYWILRYESMLGEHYLEHAGTAADVEAKYGKG